MRCPQIFRVAHARDRPIARWRAPPTLPCGARGTPLPPTPDTHVTDHLRPNLRTQMPSPGRRVSTPEAPERAAVRRTAAVATVARGGTRAWAGVASGTMRGHGAGVPGALGRGRAGPCGGVAADFGCCAIAPHWGCPARRAGGRDAGRWEPSAVPGRLRAVRGWPAGSEQPPRCRSEHQRGVVGAATVAMLRFQRTGPDSHVFRDCTRSHARCGHFQPVQCAPRLFL